MRIELTRMFVLDRDADPRLLALRLLELRHADDPYVIEHRDRWAGQLGQWSLPLFPPASAALDVSTQDLIAAVLMGCGWAVQRPGSYSSLSTAKDVVATQGLDDVASSIERHLLEDLRKTLGEPPRIRWRAPRSDRRSPAA